MKKYIYAIATAVFCVIVYWSYGNEFVRGKELGSLLIIVGWLSGMAFVAGSWVDEEDIIKARRLAK